MRLGKTRFGLLVLTALILAELGPVPSAPAASPTTGRGPILTVATRPALAAYRRRRHRRHHPRRNMMSITPMTPYGGIVPF